MQRGASAFPNIMPSPGLKPIREEATGAAAAHLFSYLIGRPFPFLDQTPAFYNALRSPVTPAANRFSGSLYILIDGFCFSATGFLPRFW